uniref:Uncharacterized protein n=1 Tax=Oryza barthii TaxID=65489 RepID=A0A0D3HHL2_9ORYZ
MDSLAEFVLANQRPLIIDRAANYDMNNTHMPIVWFVKVGNSINCVYLYDGYSEDITTDANGSGS